MIVVRCNVFCGAVTVRRPDWLMRKREERLAAKENLREQRAAAKEKSGDGA